MKALILAGGKGSRLRPITHTSAKQLLPLANKPILFYAVEALKQAGIDDIGIVVGDTKKDVISTVGDGSIWGIKITYIEQEAPLGLAHAVKIARDYVQGDRFVVYLGDNLIKNGINSIVDDFRKNKPNAQILLAKVKNANEFGVAELSGKKVVGMEEKPKNPKSDYALVGVYLFDSSIFEAVNAIKPSKRGELEITDAIQYLIDKKYRVDSSVVDGWWKDTGKLEDILEANRLLLDNIETKIMGQVDLNSKVEGKVFIDEGAEIIASCIRGPAVIGKNCRIKDSFIGPYTSVYNEVVIDKSEVGNSIILWKSKLEDIRRVEDSLIGKEVQISKTDQKPSAYKIMVGDCSKIEIP